MFFAAANLALLCSAIFSLRALREEPGPTDFENEDELVCEEVSEPFGLLGSFSRAVLSRLSNVSSIFAAL